MDDELLERLEGHQISSIRALDAEVITPFLDGTIWDASEVVEAHRSSAPLLATLPPSVRTATSAKSSPAPGEHPSGDRSDTARGPGGPARPW